MPEYKFPQFFRFIKPIIEVLKELGGSGNAAEVADAVIGKLNIPDEELSATIKSGMSRVRNQIGWARFILVKAGLLDSSQRGIWTLTEQGFKTSITDEFLLDLYKRKKNFDKQRREVNNENDITPDKIEEAEENGLLESPNYQSELLNLLKTLPAEGFERLCQRLLRESGFEQVIVTGKSGDGGIDGHGILQVNPFVSFSVYFQSKRYKGSVSASQVRDFRGAMLGRADKGIIITTGTFTLDAKKEARRDGVPPVELVDGDKLIEMFEALELGLKPKKDFEINYEFFKEFM